MNLKKSIALFLALCFMPFSGLIAQKVVRGTDGNYTAVSKAANVPDANTGNTFTDSKGTVLPVFINGKGKIFVKATSVKTGKEYKKYLKLDTGLPTIKRTAKKRKI